MTVNPADCRRPFPADSVERATEAVRCFPRSHWLDLIRRDQSERWRNGAGVPAEAYFDLLPELRQDLEEALVLVCGEVRVRSETGERIAMADYTERFPDLADDLAIQFELDGILGNLTGGVAELTESEPDEIHLPGFQILRPIGRGASGRVYLARQLSVDRLVAIKMIPIWNLDESQLRRHWQEASILSKMKHSNVVQIYDVIEDAGTLYSVIEYVDGPTLAEFTAGQPQAPPAAAALVRVLASAVHAVHEAGILHRDLKPSNVLMTSRGEPKITDFGLAKLLSNSSLVTTAHCLLGTPSYMPPEQAGGDSRATFREGDVYSLGAILYELLTGLPPFLGVTILDTLTMIRERDPISPRTTQPHIPRDLETICLKCLSKSPAARYRTADELADDLGRFMAGRTILARRPAVAERVARWSRRNPVIAALTAGLVITGVLGFLGVVWQWRQAEHARSSESLARHEADQRARDASEGLERLKMANSFLESGHGYVLARHWDDAHAAFTRAIELRPDHVQVWEARGEFLYVRLGLWDLAAHDMWRAFELQPPNFAHRWWWNALLRVHQGDLAGYREICSRFQERYARNGGAEHAYFLVRCLVLSPGKLSADQNLVNLADELALGNPNHSAYSHLQALTLLRARRPELAIERCRESLAADPRGFCRELNYPILALAHHQLSQMVEARAALERAIDAMRQWTTERCEPGPDSWVVDLGASGYWPISSWDWLEFEIYVREARAALGLDPAEGDPRWRLLRARAFAGLRRFEAADQEYTIALAKLPNDPHVQSETHRNRAYCLALRTDYHGAAEEFAQASALNADDCRLMEFQTLTRLAAGEIDAYRALCAKMMRRFGETHDHAVANYVVHACVLHAGGWSDPEQLVKLGRVAKASYFGGARVLGAAYYRAGAYGKSVECFEQAGRISPLKPCDMAFCAMAHSRLGHKPQAQSLLAAALRGIDDLDRDKNDLTAERPSGGGWYEKVQAPIVIREAETLIGAAPHAVDPT